MKFTLERKSSYHYMEYLRVIAAIAVIVIHVSGANWFRIDIGSFNWVVQTFFNVSARFGLSIFVMITGALLLKPGKELEPKQLFSRYIRRILICLIAWIVLYALLYLALNGGGMSYFISRLFQHPDHLWYLFMLIGIYLALPLLRLIAKDRKLTLYLIWLLNAFSILSCISTMTGFFGDMCAESYGYPLWQSFLENLDNARFAFIAGHLNFFLIGHYIHEYGLGRWRKPMIIAAIPAMLLSSLLTVWLSLTTGKYVYGFMLESNPLHLISAAGVFAWLRGEGPVTLEEAKDEKTTKILWLAQNTFGIFLVHFAFREIFAKFGFTVASFPAILSVPVITVLIFVLSLAVTVLIKKVPGLRRIVS